jgi:hypothetical protein
MKPVMTARLSARFGSLGFMTSLLRRCADVLTPAVAHLANLSFGTMTYKTAQDVPLLKKPGFDVNETASHSSNIKSSYDI